MESFYTNQAQTVLGLIDDDTQMYIIQLVGQVKRPFYHKVFQKVLERSRKQPYQKILLNYRDLENNPDFGRRWFTTYFLRRFYKITQGIQLAVVSPQNPIERTSISLFYALIKTLGIAVKVRFFDEVMEAKEWLEDTEIDTNDHETPFAPKEKVKEIALDKQSKLKIRLRFDPKGKLNEDDKPFILLPNLKAARDFFRFKKNEVEED